MSDDVLIQVDGNVARIRLNRPKAIHALNTVMCATMIEALDDWHDRAEIEAVILDHADGRGFCAGGDIRMIAQSGARDGADARAFFRTEYRMNNQLFTYVKPIVAFMDGVTMGGGVGISLPARYRVATENTRFAMPETGIGLFPDVGGGWYLSRLPGRVGQYLALTGRRLDGAECLSLGLATHYLPSESVEQAKQAIIADPRAIDAILDRLSVVPPEASIDRERDAIDRLFAADRLEPILAALAQDGGDWASGALKTLSTKSPQAMKVSLKLLLDGRAMPTFEDEMRQEYAVATHIVQRHDLIEGVRALIVDKDNAPRWNPDSAEGVSGHLIDQIFAPLSAADEWTPE